jgi:hypothetical protein
MNRRTAFAVRFPELARVEDNVERFEFDVTFGAKVVAAAEYERGWADGWAARDDELQALFGLLRPVLASPRHAELEKARAHTDDPCQMRCGRCSRCARARAVVRNRRRFGTNDFPGGAA